MPVQDAYPENRREELSGARKLTGSPAVTVKLFSEPSQLQAFPQLAGGPCGQVVVWKVLRFGPRHPASRRVIER